MKRHIIERIRKSDKERDEANCADTMVSSSSDSTRSSRSRLVVPPSVEATVVDASTSSLFSVRTSNDNPFAPCFPSMGTLGTLGTMHATNAVHSRHSRQAMNAMDNSSISISNSNSNRHGKHMLDDSMTTAVTTDYEVVYNNLRNKRTCISTIPRTFFQPIPTLEGTTAGSGKTNAASAALRPAYSGVNATPRNCVDPSYSPVISNASVDPSFISDHLKNMTLQEQFEAQKDISGESQAPPETPQLLEDSLRELDQELTAIKRKQAYDRAMFLSPMYVKDPEFRLLFLRADRFDPKKAAERMVAHFESKLELFDDPVTLARDITWNDLDKEDRLAYLDGGFQIFTSDPMGRRIVFNILALQATDTPNKNRFRAAWYAYMSAMRDNTQTQRKGLVMVSYALDLSATKLYKVSVQQAQSRFLDVLPVRFEAMHLCFASTALLRTLMAVAESVVDQSLLLRFRTHVGSHLECQYSLASYGIRGMSIATSGELDQESFLRRHCALLEKERATAEMDRFKYAARNIIPCPQPRSVLLGRGAPYQSFAGNIILNDMIKQHKNMYLQSKDKASKTAISSHIVKCVQDAGGTFLKRDSTSHDHWIPVSDDVAREKVAMGFRNLARRKANSGPVSPGSSKGLSKVAPAVSN